MNVTPLAMKAGSSKEMATQFTQTLLESRITRNMLQKIMQVIPEIAGEVWDFYKKLRDISSGPLINVSGDFS